MQKQDERQPTIQSRTRASSIRLRLIAVALTMPLIFVCIVLGIPAKRFQGPVEVRQFGWPLIHFEQVSLPEYGSASSPVTFLLEKPRSSEIDIYGNHRLRFGGSSEFVWIGDRIGAAPYWTFRENWNYFMTEVSESKLYWSGLLANVAMISLAIAILHTLLYRRLCKRGLRISLIDLGIVTAIFALVFGYYTKFNYDQNRREELEAHEFVGLYNTYQSIQSQPEWLVRLAGTSLLPVETHFRNLTISYTNADQEQINYLARNAYTLRQVTSVRIVDLPVDQAKTLQVFGQTVELSLLTPRIQKEDWGCLAKMENLETIRINGRDKETVELPASFFAALVSCRDLKQLSLYNCRFTTEDFAKVKELPNLRWIRLIHTSLNQEIVQTLSEMPALKRLNVLGPKHHLESASEIKTTRPDIQLQFKF